MSLESFLEQLADPNASLPASDFVEASDLSLAELGKFARVWFSLSVERQRALINQMVELAEDNAELDFSAVYKMALKGKDEELLQKAMEGLWEHEDRSLIPILVQLLRSDHPISVRAAAATALGKFSNLAEDGKLLAKDSALIRDTLLEALQNEGEDSEVRRRSLEAVAPFNAEGLSRHIRWAYESGDLKLRGSAIYAMGRSGEVSWLPFLLKELENREPLLRYEAANACGDLGEEDVVPHLIPLLDDDDYQVQLACVNALGKIGGALSKRALLRCVKNGDAALEEAAQAALANIEFLDDPIAFTRDA